LRWQATGPMSRDYGVTLQLLDHEGHVWGLGHKTLSDIEGETYLDDNQVEQIVMIPTSRWPIDEMTVQTFELPIDVATPPGRYRVQLRVHPKETWDSLHILDAAGAFVAHDWEVGDAEVLSARAAPDPLALDMDQRTDADMAPAVRLLGLSALPSVVRPGDTFTLSLYWRKMARTREDYQLELALHGYGKTWSRSVTSPVRSDYSTRRWYLGEVLRGQKDILVDAATPPGAYLIYAALLDEGGAPAAEPLRLGSIRVEGRQRAYKAPPISHAVHAKLGGLVTLLGYDISSPTLKQRESLSLTLYWQADDRTKTSYKVFAHIIDDEDRVWAQQDNEPMNGAYPTTAWLPGEIITDEYAIPIAEGLAGSYRVEVGIYDPQTGARLPATNALGERQVNDRIILQRISVVE